MSPLKKILEKPVTEKDLEKIKWLHKGMVVIDEKARKAALEQDVEFMEKEGETLSPEEFHSALFSKKFKKELVPEKYKEELQRYHDMFVSNMSDVLKETQIKNAKLGQMLGVPEAKENIFEIKKEGKVVGFIHLNKDSKTIDFITDVEELPKKFKEKLEG